MRSLELLEKEEMNKNNSISMTKNALNYTNSN
jgi:hypothetical protein